MSSMQAQAFVLLSGGIDSTTCLHIAIDQFGRENVNAVSIDYGQRHVKETACAIKTCEAQRIHHSFLDLSSVVPKTMLTDVNSEVPDISYDEIEGVSPTYVPFRNGLMISALTSFAQGKLQDLLKPTSKGYIEVPENEWALYFGAHAEDAHNWAYPDCTPEFIGALANAVYIGTYQAVRLHTPLMWLRKDEIVSLGERLGVNWKTTWSCYKGEDLHCGVCPTCRARKEAFKGAGVIDPTEYQH